MKSTSTDSILQKISNFAFNHKMWFFLASIGVYAVIRTVISWWMHGNPEPDSGLESFFHGFEKIPADIDANMDFLGYFLALITFVIGTRIAYSLDKKAEEKDSEVQAVLSRIHNAAENLEDVTRSVVDTFPKLFDHIEKMLSEAKAHKGSVKIMNRTSSFGRIHSYNWDTVREFLPPDSPKSYSEEFFTQGVTKFIERIEKIESLIEECSKLHRIQYLFFDEQSLQDLFIKDYLESMDSDTKGSSKIIYYRELGDGIEVLKDLEEEDKRDRITKAVLKKHARAFKDYLQAREGKQFDDCENVIKLTKDPNQIPMQIYLTKFKEDPNKERITYRTLVIFAVDEVDSGRVARTLIGISSSLKRMYNVFDTFFNEPFKN